MASISERQLRESLEGRLRELKGMVAELEAILAGGESGGNGSGNGHGLATTGGESSEGRAPYGSNQAQIIAVITENPGIGVSEIAAQTGIKARVVTSTVYRLKRRGEIERHEGGLRLPGG